MDVAWTAMTSRLPLEDIDECEDGSCDGQFKFDDGDTFYSYNISGIHFEVDTVSECVGLMGNVGGGLDIDDKK